MAASKGKGGAKGGRPPKLTKASSEAIVRMVSEGAYLAHAAGAIEVDPRTVKRWMSRGRQDQEAGESTTYARFFVAVSAARNRGAVVQSKVIFEAGKRQWPAALTWLSRQFPLVWGPPRPDADRSAGHLDGDEDGGLDDEDMLELTPAELEEFHEHMSGAQGLLERGRRRRRDG